MFIYFKKSTDVVTEAEKFRFSRWSDVFPVQVQRHEKQES